MFAAQFPDLVDNARQVDFQREAEEYRQARLLRSTETTPAD